MTLMPITNTSEDKALHEAGSSLATLKKWQERFDKVLKQDPLLFGRSDSLLSQACFYALHSGGKRFRPAIVYLIASAQGKSDLSQAIDFAACAVEFFHTASLIADDLPCMDDDDERRGRPSTHKAFGESTALLASYALIAEGFGMIGRAALAAKLPHSLAPALENATYNTGARGATGGQYLDIFPEVVDQKSVLEALNKKTVTLFEVAFVLGWLFSGGAVEKLEEVKNAARSFGMAFQIADDLSDADEDSAAGRAVNLAAAIGKTGATEALKNEIEQFKKSLKNLGLHAPELSALVDSLLI